MKQFLLDNEKDVLNMLALQWSFEDAQRASFLDGKDEGINIGKTQGINIGEIQKSEEIALKILRKGKDLAEIQEWTDLSIQRIQELANSINN